MTRNQFIYVFVLAFVALGLAASSAMLVFDDWRSGGVAADVWRGARERLRI